jgi:hypothetical protein
MPLESTGFISRVSPSWLMTEEPLPTPAEPSVVAHDTKNSKGQDSIVRIVRRPTEAQPPEAFTMARMPARMAGDRVGQAWVSPINSGSGTEEPEEVEGSCPRAPGLPQVQPPVQRQG